MLFLIRERIWPLFLTKGFHVVTWCDKSDFCEKSLLSLDNHSLA